MAGQHTENLFRRFKGQIVAIKTVSGGAHEGRVTEATNDYVCLIEGHEADATEVFVFYKSVESAVLVQDTSRR